MNLNLGNMWIYIVATTCGVALLRIGITGQVRSVGRGSARGITASVRSAPLRAGLILAGATLVICTFLHALGRSNWSF